MGLSCAHTQRDMYISQPALVTKPCFVLPLQLSLLVLGVAVVCLSLQPTGHSIQTLTLVSTTTSRTVNSLYISQLDAV